MHAAIIAIAFAVGQPAADLGEARDEAPQALAQLPVDHRHKFGVDQQALARDMPEVKLPGGLLKAIDAWAGLPDKIERAASWGTFGAGALAAVVAGLVVAVGVVAMRKG